MQKPHRTLDQLRVGQSALVHSFKDEELSLKLIEMGCVPGEKITVKRIAPLGGTMAIAVFGYTLGLRFEEAAGIVISPEQSN
jgi:ferrous iron transport protein A